MPFAINNDIAPLYHGELFKHCLLRVLASELERYHEPEIIYENSPNKALCFRDQNGATHFLLFPTSKEIHNDHCSSLAGSLAYVKTLKLNARGSTFYLPVAEHSRHPEHWTLLVIQGQQTSLYDPSNTTGFLRERSLRTILSDAGYDMQYFYPTATGLQHWRDSTTSGYFVAAMIPKLTANAYWLPKKHEQRQALRRSALDLPTSEALNSQAINTPLQELSLLRRDAPSLESRSYSEELCSDI